MSWTSFRYNDGSIILEMKNLNKAYKNYEKEWMLENPPFAGPYTNPCLTKEEFANKVKNDPEFSKKWLNEFGVLR